MRSVATRVPRHHHRDTRDDGMRRWSRPRLDDRPGRRSTSDHDANRGAVHRCAGHGSRRPRSPQQRHRSLRAASPSKPSTCGFRPAVVDVEQAGTYEVTLDNTGAISHDLTFDDGTKIVAEAGETVTGSVDIPAGGIGFICSIPGHEAAGMRGSVAVRQTAAAPTDPRASHSMDPDDHGGLAPSADVEPDPAAPAAGAVRPGRAGSRSTATSTTSTWSSTEKPR